jgi:hypothetical protein
MEKERLTMTFTLPLQSSHFCKEFILGGIPIAYVFANRSGKAGTSAGRFEKRLSK